MLKFLTLYLLFLPHFLFSQKDYQTNVLIKKDFQESTFQENDKKFAKEYFDKIYVKIEAKLKSDIAADKSLGIRFNEKDATVIFQIGFYIGDEGEGKLPHLKLGVIDSINKYEITWWRHPYALKEATNFKDRLEQYTEGIDETFKYYNLHILFGKFCSYNKPDLSWQKRHMKNYRNIIILPLKKSSKFQMIHNIATNSLISNNYNEYQSARGHLGIFVLPSNSIREKDDIAVSLDIKEEKDSLVVKVSFFGKNINLITPIEVKTTVKIDKKRFYNGDYLEANYVIGDIFDSFHINNFMLAN